VHKKLLIGLVGLLIPNQLFAGPLSGENLIQPLPQGFKAAWSISQSGMDMTEFVLAPETIDNWTRLITTQVFHGKGDKLSSAFAQGWGKRMTNACPSLTHSQLITGLRNGYALSFVQVNCPNNPQTGKREFVFLEVFQGKDALYSVQYAFRYQPSPAEIGSALSFLKSLTVCDSRSADHPCPN
jgi:hypothetical protein